MAPDSNINHATRSDTLGTVLGDFDIDQASKAKSGVGLSVRGQAYRRFAIGNSDHNLRGMGDWWMPDKKRRFPTSHRKLFLD